MNTDPLRDAITDAVWDHAGGWSRDARRLADALLAGPLVPLIAVAEAAQAHIASIHPRQLNDDLDWDATLRELVAAVAGLSPEEPT